MATATEYGLIAALVGVVVISAVVTIPSGGWDSSEPASAQTESTPTVLRLDDLSSPILVMESSGPIVECLEGFEFVPRARPVGARPAMSCEPAN